ncbi:MAG: hypothetical protein R6W76_05235 [Caldilinea sp.]
MFMLAKKLFDKDIFDAEAQSRGGSQRKSKAASAHSFSAFSLPLCASASKWEAFQTACKKKWEGLPVRYNLPELLILLLAALTRFWRLDHHSFWFDESVSLQWARSDASYIWQSTFPLIKDKHPPGYYLLLHAWQTMLEAPGLARNDVALRSLGALLGVLTVLGILLLARRLSGRPTALLAGGNRPRLGGLLPAARLAG